MRSCSGHDRDVRDRIMLPLLSPAFDPTMCAPAPPFVHDHVALAIVLMGLGTSGWRGTTRGPNSGLRTGFVSPGWAAQKHPLWDELAGTGRGSGEEVTVVSERHQEDR